MLLVAPGQAEPRAAQENVVLVVDRSGSMSGCEDRAGRTRSSSCSTTL